MKQQSYKMASWWLIWEDVIYPEAGIKQKIADKTKNFKTAGIDTVVIFGCHFRWDFIYNWERFHLLLKAIVDSCHAEGIKVFDHHSANLVHRVNSAADYESIMQRNRHHVPLFPSREFADNITYNGHKLNDFRMLSVQDDQPCYLENYNAEIFCMNNPDFITAYKKYLKALLQTGIDGLMSDDVIYYPDWDGCGCEHCRKKFKAQYGHELPPANDENFWGNYESMAFKEWIKMRYQTSADFLHAVKTVVGEEFPLMSCCSGSSAKILNGFGMSAEIMAQSLNHVMLEICGEIVSDYADYTKHIPDFMLHKAIADQYGYPNIGLGYAHNADSAFTIWALNKMFNSSTWISTLTGRFGIAEALRKTIPDEAAIIQEAFQFEQQHATLFQGHSAANVALLFSLDNLMYNGCHQTTYSQPWQDIATDLFRQNIQFDVVLKIPDPQSYPLLILSNLVCVDQNTATQLLNYRQQGGTIIATGALGSRDGNGNIQIKSLLATMGIEHDKPPTSGRISPEKLFNGQTADISEPTNAQSITQPASQWTAMTGFYWAQNMPFGKVSQKTKELLPPLAFNIKCSAGWSYRLLKVANEARYFIHLLSTNIEPIPYKNFKNNFINEPIVASLDFLPTDGEVVIKSHLTKAILHSPDLHTAIKISADNGYFKVNLNKIKRYAVIELSNI